MGAAIEMPCPFTLLPILPSVCPELVEGLFFFQSQPRRKEQPFDKLRANGGGVGKGEG